MARPYAHDIVQRCRRTHEEGGEKGSYVAIGYEAMVNEVEALLAERDRMATDAGVSRNLLEEVADGIIGPTREEIQQRHDELYAILRAGTINCTYEGDDNE